MWLSEQSRIRPRPVPSAQVGAVTLPGDPAGVWTDGERRALPLYTPGGYFWRPAQGQQVLVLKTGQEGEAPCIAGALCGPEQVNLEPGEILLSNEAASASILLRKDGTVEIKAVKLTLNGSELQA